MRVAFLVAPEGVEQVELTEPWQAVGDAGGERALISTERRQVQAFNHLDKGDTFSVDRTVGASTVGEYDALVLPGGVANPDFLRTDPPPTPSGGARTSGAPPTVSAAVRDGRSV